MNMMPRNVEAPEVEERTVEEIQEERAMILQRIQEIYDEPIVSRRSEEKRNLAISSLYARKRHLEVQVQ